MIGAIASNFKSGELGLVLSLDATNISSYPGTGTIWYDLSGKGNNATIIGSPVFNSTTKDFYFNAIAKYITLPISSPQFYPRTGSYTYRFYVNCTISNNYQQIFKSTIGYGGTGMGIGLYTSTATRMSCKLTDDSSVSSLLSIASAGNYSNVYIWFTIIINRADNTFKVYAGNILTASASISSLGAISEIAANPIIFGNGGSNNMYGQKVKFYNRALDVSEL